MLNKSLNELFVRWTYRIRRSSDTPNRLKHFIRPRLEEAEERLAPANLIAPVVADPTFVSQLTRDNPKPLESKPVDFSNPVVAVNPTNTNQQVMVAMQKGDNTVNPYLPDRLGVVALFSQDAGVTWATVPGFGARLQDPTVAYNVFANFSDASSPSVTMGRDGVFYIAYLQHTADRSAGALIVESFGFSANPAIRPDKFGNTQAIIYRWQNGQDPALNPTIGVDSNTPTLTSGSFTQTDTLVDPDTGRPKAVVLAWNTRAIAPSPNDYIDTAQAPNFLSNFNPNAIFTSFSADAGQSFSSPLPVNGSSITGFTGRMIGPLAGFLTPTASGGAAPVIAFSPGTGTTTGGLLTYAWAGTDPGTGKTVAIQTDISRLDGAVPSQTAGFTQTYQWNGASTNIADALLDGIASGVDKSVTTTFPITVSDPTVSGFTTLTDVTVSVAMVHPFLNQVRLDLVAPNGKSIRLVNTQTNNDGTAITNVFPYNPGFSPPPAQNTTIPFQPRQGLGLSNNKILGTLFSDYAPRRINDPLNTFPYIGSYRPESWRYANGIGALSVMVGATAAQVTGDWQLQVTDFRNDRPGVNTGQTTQFMNSIKLNITGGVRPGFGSDSPITGAVTVPAGKDFFTNPVNVLPVATDANGIAPGVSIAYDTSIQPLNNGATPFGRPAGQLYAAFTHPVLNIPGDAIIDTQIRLRQGVVTNVGAVTWAAAVQVNNDTASDNFSEGNRPQFQPTVAVDPSTGTVGVMWYDTRYDANLIRVSTYFATSIDGGNTFTPSPDGGATVTPQVYLNPSLTATNAITFAVDGSPGKANSKVTIEPIPTNNPAVGGIGLGLRQSLVAIAPGKFASYWTGNPNYNGSSVFRNQIITPAGPRVIRGDMGPVANNTLSDIVIAFDRPIEASTFTANDVVIQFRSAQNAISVAPTILIPGVDYGNPIPLNDNGLGAASQFFIPLVNQTAIGTYSYTIGADIRDTILRLDTANPVLVNGPVLPTFISTDTPGPNGKMISSGSINTIPPFIPLVLSSTTTSSIFVPIQTGAFQFVGSVKVIYNITGDATFTPSSITLTSPDGRTFALPVVKNVNGFTVNTAAFNGVPLTGTWVLTVVMNTVNASGFIKNWSLDLTPAKKTFPTIGGNLMDQNTSGTAGDAGADPDVFAAPAPDRKRGNTTPFTFPYDSLTLPLIITGPKLLSTSIVGQPATSDNLVLNGSTNSIDVTFDRPMAAATFEADGRDIIRITGPVGVIFDKLEWDTTFPGKMYPVSVVQQSPTTFRVFFPRQVLSGAYNIEIGSKIAAASGPTTDFLDTNQNAGLSILRGTGDPVTGQFVSDTYNTTPGAVSILAGQSVMMPLDIQDLFTITQNLANRIKLNLDITFPNDPALSADLIAPDGTTVRLFSGVGGNGPGPFANFSNTSFNDGGGTAIQSGTAPFSSGPYTSQFPLSTLSGSVSRKLDALGVSIPWQLKITNNGPLQGTINRYSLTLPHVLTGTGLGEPVDDRFVVGFRLFNQDATNPLTKQVWSPVGPAPTNSQANSSRITGIAVDPSDPTSNTVYIGGASGGIWKSSNFLTTDGDGPNWEPLTDFGSVNGLNTGSIAVFGRNNDPSQSIIFALTGEGDTGTPGVGVLRSMDGGKTWVILDSTTNVDATGKILPVDSNLRDRTFFNSTGFKILVDPTLTPTGDVITYIATSGNNGGVWRSIDTGKHWTQIRAGNADDIVLSAGSRSTSNISSGALEFLYATFRGDGIYTTSQATSAVSMQNTFTAQGNPLIRDLGFGTKFYNPTLEVTIDPPGGTPNGGKGRIAIAGPAATGDVVLDTSYQGWLYALVSNTGGSQDGFYQTKDFGRNWTKVHLALYNPQAGVGFPTNNETRGDVDLFNPGIGGVSGGQGDYDIAITVDPNNPQIVYLAGLGAGNGSQPQPTGGLIRVDLSAVNDTQALVFYDNSSATASVNAAGTNQTNTIGGVKYRDLVNFGSLGGLPGFGNVTNLSRDPSNPFTSNATVLVSNTANFTNTGENAKYAPFHGFTSTADVHRMVTIKDQLTGRTRIIATGDQQVATGVDDGTGNLVSGIGSATAITGTRNGNLQLTQFYSGAVQPSQLAVDISQAVFYGMAQDNGFPVSGPNALRGGDLNWTGVVGDGTQVVTDQTGSGTAYQYRQPCCQNDGVDATGFFRVITPGTGPSGVSRTNGLLQAGDNPGQNQGQWPQNSIIGFFAVNPIDPNGVVIVSQVGRIFRTTNQAKNWQPIGEPTNAPGDVQSVYSRAVAFGSPDPANPGLLNNFIYAGNDAGQVFVTYTGGAPWTNISNGIAGSGAVMQIVPDPSRGSRAAYAVTTGGIFYIADSNAAGATWVNISGAGANNIFQLRRQIFGDVNDKTTNASLNSTEPLAIRSINAITADWRYAIPVDPLNPAAGNFPILYVAGEGGVFRSLDQGTTWKSFPGSSTLLDPTTGKALQDPLTGNNLTVPEGGFLPSGSIQDLDLALGNIDPLTGFPKQNSGGFNMLVASTYGRGSFAIRLDDPLPQYNVLFQSGPRVVGLAASSASSIRVRFDAPVDPATFDLSDIVVKNSSGTIIPVASITPIANPGNGASDQRNLFQINFVSPQPAGVFNVVIGPKIFDFAGFGMNQDQDRINGETAINTFTGQAQDAYVGPFTITANPQHGNLFLDIQAIARAGDPVPVTVSAVGTDGNILTGFNGVVTFSTTDGLISIGAGLPNNYQFTGLDSGIHTFTVTFKTANFLTSTTPTFLTVTDTTAATASTPLGSATGSIIIRGGAATKFAISNTPVAVVAGTNSSVTVTAVDQFGNVADGYTDAITFSSTDPLVSVGVGKGLPANYAFTAAEFGSHTFTNEVTLKTATSDVILMTGPVQTLTVVDVLSGLLTGVSKPGIIVLPAVAASYAVDKHPATTVAGTDNDFRVVVKDAFGNTATSYAGTVHFTSTDNLVMSGNGLPLDYQFNKSVDKGIHTFLLGAALKTAGTQSITATDTVAVPTITGSQTLITVTNAKASALTVTGHVPTTIAGTKNDFTVFASDKYGNLAVDYAGIVTFASSDPLLALGNGLPTNYAFLTGDKGSHDFKLGATLKTAGLQSITAKDTVGLFAGTQSNILVTPASAASFIISNTAITVVAGTPSSATVTAKDQFGNVATGYTGQVTFTSSDPLVSPGNGLPTDYVFLSKEKGVHTFTNEVILKTATSDVILGTGPVQTLSIRDFPFSTIKGSTAPGGIIVTPDVAASLEVKGHPSPTVAGLANDFKVIAHDKYGNTASGYTGVVGFTTSDKQVAAGNGLPTAYTFTATDGGVKTFTQGAVLKTAGTQSITATDSGTPPLTASQTGIVVVANVASAFTISGHPTPTIAGTANSFTVIATDKYSNLASGYTGTVTFTSSDPLVGPSNGLPANYTFTSTDAGKHAFPLGATLKTAGIQSISVTDTKTSFTGTQSNILVTPNVAASFAITGFPNPTTAGAAGQYTVTAKDQFNNLATGYVGTVTFSSTDPLVAINNGLPTNYTFTAADTGAKTFTATLKTAGLQSITGKDTANAAITGQQVGILVNADVAASFTLSGYPSPVQAGTTNNFTVTAKDKYGNVSTKYAGTVTLSSSDLQISSNKGLPPTFTFSSLDAGQHVFQATFKTFGAQSLTATDIANQALKGTQAGIQVTSGALSIITVSGFPSPVVAGQTSGLTVAAADQFGNPVSNYVGIVTFSSSDKQAGLPTNYKFTLADAGRKTFTGVSLKTAGVQSLSATDTANAALTGTESNITVLAGAPAKFVLGGFPSPVQALVPATFGLTAFDAYGNVAVDYNGSAIITSSDPKAIVANPVQFSKGVAVSGITFRADGAETVTAQDTGNVSLMGTVALTVTPAPEGTTGSSTPFDLSRVTAVGTDAGIASLVRVLNPDGTVRNSFSPYDPSFTGGVRVAIARTPTGFNVITAPGPGRFPDIRVIDPVTGNTLSTITPFETSFEGGEFISTADINNDGYDDYVITPDKGGGPRVVVINGKTGARIADFFGIEDSAFRGGARAALTDINGDGVTDMIVSAGFGGGPRISVINGKDIAAGSPNPSRLIGDFFAFEPELRNGAYVAAGDLNNDGKGDIILGAGPGGGPRVRIINGKQLLAIAQFGGLDEAVAVEPQTQIANFFGGDPNSRGGIRVVAKKLDSDDFADLVVGGGPGSGSTVTAYKGSILLSNVNPDPLFTFEDVPGFTGGVFVG